MDTPAAPILAPADDKPVFNGARPIVPADLLCSSRTKKGKPCSIGRIPGSDRCIFHSPRKPPPLAEEAVVVPSITMRDLGHLNIRAVGGIDTARDGIWQNLLAGTLAPHVAKVALDVAETIAKSARTRSDSSTLASELSARLQRKTPRTPQGETDTPPGGGESAGEGSE